MRWVLRDLNFYEWIKAFMRKSVQFFFWVFLEFSRFRNPGIFLIIFLIEFSRFLNPGIFWILNPGIFLIFTSFFINSFSSLNLYVKIFPTYSKLISLNYKIFHSSPHLHIISSQKLMKSVSGKLLYRIKNLSSFYFS